jgi:AraC family transcriptional regulator
MNPVEKSLWYIESHFASDISLDDIARVSGVSRFHLVRAFAEAVGVPVMRYVRGRRLTEAARQLADGAPDILAVALDAGYGSHEAFTRAFRDQFGLTPEAVRAQGHLKNLELVEPIKMNDIPYAKLDAPRISAGVPLLIAGFSERLTAESSKVIPALWQRFGSHLGHIPGQRGQTAYGVCYNFDDDGNFDYLAGVEVADAAQLPPEFTQVRIPTQTYAVFEHRDHISGIRRTFSTIWKHALADAGLQATDGPFFEKYGPSFDLATGNGGVEIWIPLKK